MAFKMKGSPHKMGKIQGTSGYTSALKQVDEERKAAMEEKSALEMKSPLEQGTSWWDKTKALGRAVWDAKDEVHGGVGEAQRLYKQYKKEYRDEDKESSNKMKSPLEQKEDSEKVRETYYQEELKKLQADPDIGDPDPKQDEKDARKASEEKYYKEKTKSPAEMKSPLEQKEDIMVMATRPGSRTVQKGNKSKIYSKEEGDKGKRRNITKTVVNEKTGKTKSRKITEGRAGRQIERAQKRAAKGKGSVSSPLEQKLQPGPLDQGGFRWVKGPDGKEKVYSTRERYKGVEDDKTNYYRGNENAWYENNPGMSPTGESQAIFEGKDEEATMKLFKGHEGALGRKFAPWVVKRGKKAEKNRNRAGEMDDQPVTWPMDT